MLSKDEVQYIASLARIHFKEEEMETFRKTLAAILQYVEKLNTLDISEVNPTSHVLPLKDVFRPDIVQPSLSQQEALAIAVLKTRDAFKVPQVIE